MGGATIPGIPRGIAHDGGVNNHTTLPATPIPQTLCCGYSTFIATQPPNTVAGLIFPNVVANVGHFTGTLTVSAHCERSREVADVGDDIGKD